MGKCSALRMAQSPIFPVLPQKSRSPPAPPGDIARQRRGKTRMISSSKEGVDDAGGRRFAAVIDIGGGAGIAPVAMPPKNGTHYIGDAPLGESALIGVVFVAGHRIRHHCTVKIQSPQQGSMVSRGQRSGQVVSRSSVSMQNSGSPCEVPPNCCRWWPPAAPIQQSAHWPAPAPQTARGGSLLSFSARTKISARQPADSARVAR